MFRNFVMIPVSTLKVAGAVTLFVLLFAAAGLQSAAAQTFVTLDYPGATATQAYDISDSGIVVGRYVDANKAIHGFVYSGSLQAIDTSKFATLDVQGAAWTALWGINKNGDIVGQYGSKTDTLIHGFLYSGGNFTYFDQPGQFNTMPQGINRAGYIVGCMHNSGTMQGWVMLNGSFLSGGSPAYQMYTGVNDSGSIVGWYVDPTTTTEHSFVLSGIGRTEFQYPGAAITEAQGLNALGDIVGSYGPSATLHGFLLRNGSFESIDFSGSGVAWTRAFGINAEGIIVGVYSNGPIHGFIRVP